MPSSYRFFCGNGLATCSPNLHETIWRKVSVRHSVSTNWRGWRTLHTHTSVNDSNVTNGHPNEHHSSRGGTSESWVPKPAQVHGFTNARHDWSTFSPWCCLLERQPDILIWPFRLGVGLKLSPSHHLAWQGHFQNRLIGVVPKTNRYKQPCQVHRSTFIYRDLASLSSSCLRSSSSTHRSTFIYCDRHYFSKPLCSEK